MTNRYRLASHELSAALKNWEDGEGPTIGGRKAISQALSDAIEDAINSTADEIIEGDSVTNKPIEDEDFDAVLVFDQLADAYRDFKRRACAAVSLSEIDVDGDQALWRAIYAIREWATTRYNYAPPTSIPALRSQGVGEEQIARIYGWFTSEGEPDLEKVLGEEMKPGTWYDPKKWVHPAKRKRLAAARQGIQGRSPRRREYIRESQYGKTAPPSLDELVRLGAPAPQIAALHGLEIEDAEALLRGSEHSVQLTASESAEAARLERDTLAQVEKTAKRPRYWGIHKPATVMSWNESARFVNWLNTSLGYAAAYKFTSNGHLDNISLWSETDDPLDYDPLNQYRSKRARFVLPSAHEWYKAAYYNPSDNTYYDYANGKNTAPNPSAGGTEDNTAVHEQPYLSGPADVDQAGGLSPYGVMALGGNAMEWQESSFDLRNNSVTAGRVVRGGSWYRGGSYHEGLYSTAYGGLAPDNKVEYHDIGFRVVMLSPSGEVPEPSTLVIGTLFGLGGLLAKRRIKR